MKSGKMSQLEHESQYQISFHPILTNLPQYYYNPCLVLLIDQSHPFLKNTNFSSWWAWIPIRGRPQRTSAIFPSIFDPYPPHVCNRLQFKDPSLKRTSANLNFKFFERIVKFSHAMERQEN